MDKVKNFFKELKNFEWTDARKKKAKEIWDKVTTGFLILLFATPVAILVYIFIWFANSSKF